MMDLNVLILMTLFHQMLLLHWIYEQQILPPLPKKQPSALMKIRDCSFIIRTNQPTPSPPAEMRGLLFFSTAICGLIFFYNFFWNQEVEKSNRLKIYYTDLGKFHFFGYRRGKKGSSNKNWSTPPPPPISTGGLRIKNEWSPRRHEIIKRSFLILNFKPAQKARVGHFINLHECYVPWCLEKKFTLTYYV